MLRSGIRPATRTVTRLRCCTRCRARRSVLENAPSHRLAVETSVRIERACTEASDDLAQSGRAMSDDVARRRVGVEDSGAAACEPLGDGGFAARDAAGQCNGEGRHGPRGQVRPNIFE